MVGRKARKVRTGELSYAGVVQLMKSAALILSDSGGVQEEAPSVGTPVLVLRDVTERPEAVESGCAEVVGTSRTKILEHATAWLEGAGQRPPVSRGNPFGDGKAGARIVSALQQFRAGITTSSLRAPP